MADDEHDLFKKAMENLTDEDLFAGKYGDGFDETDPSSTPQTSEAPPPEVREVREFATMEEAFFDVEPMNEKAKYRKREHRHDHEFEASDVVEKEQRAKTGFEKKSEKPTKKIDPWQEIANATREAKVLDLRQEPEHRAFRELSLSLSETAMRIVYEATERDHITQKALQTWALGGGYLYAFSPESDASSGMLAIRKKTET